MKFKRKKRKNCLICNKELNKAKSVVSSNKSIRYLTCSKECSRKLTRIRNYVNEPLIKKIKELRKMKDEVSK